jgi:uncharacterized membrane protein
VSGRPSPLDRAIEAVLTTGVLLSGCLLLAGLALERPPLLRWGILLLLATPVARVVVVTAGLLRQRDWLFALVSLWILAVLASGIYVASLVGRGPSRDPARITERGP